jgi:predicted ATPase with chaperone activity
MQVAVFTMFGKKSNNMIITSSPIFSPIRRCIALHACPCGYFENPVKPCTCSPGIVTKYQKRISGPLLERIDIHIEVPRAEYEKLNDHRRPGSK